MKSNVPKQFLQINGKPLIIYSALVYASWNYASTVVVVANPDFINETKSIFTEYPLQLPVNFQNGGPTRHDSCINGILKVLEYASEEDWVLIHDAARPMIQINDFDNIRNYSMEHPDADVISLVEPVTETVVSASQFPGNMEDRPDRSKLFIVKTPQAIRLKKAKEIMHISGSNFTDLLSWAQAAGIHGALIPSGPFNIKVTKPSDIDLAESLMKSL